MTEKKKLSDEELLEKFAVYGAEVDSVLKRQQAFDRILENTIVKISKLETTVKKMNNVFDVLLYVFIAFIITI